MSKKYEALLNDQKFVIKEDEPDVGWYLYVYKNGEIIKDHLQDNLESVKKQAEEDYSVPESLWKEI